MKKLNIIGFKRIANDSELKEQFSDMIEMFIENRNKTKEEHYKKLYKDKFGEDYKPIKEFVPEVSLYKIYSKDDFKRYQDYIKYCDNLFRLKFDTYKNLLGNLSNPSISSDQMVDFHKEIGIDIKFGNISGTEAAFVPFSSTNLIYYRPKYANEEVFKEIIIHELGHILDNRLGNISISNKLFLHNMKCSSYDLNPAEIFAEDFLNYFINPKYLKAGWSEVYEYFNKKIPGDWKSKIKVLIKMRYK